jgi:uncharacterized membrane protein
MTLYAIARILKFLAVMTYVGALAAGLSAPSALQRSRAVHKLASPALLGIWTTGATLAWLRGTSLGSAWIVGGFVMSLVSCMVLVHSVERDVRTGRVFAGCVVPLGLAIVLMVVRPRWSLW